jgi:hypothetical protein
MDSGLGIDCVPGNSAAKSPGPRFHRYTKNFGKHRGVKSSTRPVNPSITVPPELSHCTDVCCGLDVADHPARVRAPGNLGQVQPGHIVHAPTQGVKRFSGGSERKREQTSRRQDAQPNDYSKPQVNRSPIISSAM